MRYSYVAATATEWFWAADCVVPQTGAAIRRMDRFFQIDRAGVTRSAGKRGGGDIQPMGCVKDQEGCALEAIVVTAPPDERTTTTSGFDWGIWANSGGTRSGTEGEFGGWGSQGDTDGDGDTADEGPIAFSICVAAALGPTGWIAIGGTAIAAYELWGARVDVQNTWSKWLHYSTGGDTQEDSNVDPAVEQLYWSRYEDARDAEATLWRVLAATGATTFAELARSVKICIPAYAAPTP